MRFFAVTATVLLSCAIGSAAEPDGPTLSDVIVGIDGYSHVGRWTSISATVSSDKWPVQLSVWVPDPDGNLTEQPAQPIPQPVTGSARVRSLFKTGRLDGVIRLDVTGGDQTRSVTLQADAPREARVAALFHQPDRPTTRYWATLGESEGFAAAVERIIDRQQTTDRPLTLIPLSSAEDLPTQPYALGSLDMLAVVGPQPITAEVNDAIRRWVGTGGHLVVSMGRADEYAESPLSEWIPINVVGQVQLRDLSAITSQVPGSVPIRGTSTEAVQFVVPYGETLASTFNGPVWAQVPYGFGRVTFLGVDISRRPLVDWESLPLFAERLADYRQRSERDHERTATAQLSETGVSELKTQLANGLDQFPEIDKPTNWLAMGLILVYLLIIGPFDYLIVHKLLGRPHWTWVTLPLLVLVATGYAVSTARDRNVSDPVVHQVDLIDIDAASGQSRVHAWVCVASDASARHRISGTVNEDIVSVGGSVTDVDVADDESVARAGVRLSWMGLPETGFRGMYRAGGLDLARPVYHFAPTAAAIEDLPVAQWSSTSTSLDWTGVDGAAETIVTADLSSQAGQLVGTLTNRLNVPLQDWMVAHEGRAYVPQTSRLGAAALKIMPGESIDFQQRLRVQPRVLRSYLTGITRVRLRDRGTSGADYDTRRADYDPLDRDPYNILRIVSLFDAADGADFTSLSNDSLSRLDLSSLLPLDRAVLYCRIEKPAVTFTSDGDPLTPSEQTTILRIVLPVENQ